MFFDEDHHRAETGDTDVEATLIFKLLATLIFIPLLVVLTFLAGIVDAVMDTWDCVTEEVPEHMRRVWRHEIKGGENG